MYVKANIFVCLFVYREVCAQRLFLVLYLEITLGMFGDQMRKILQTEPRLTACQASTLLTVLSIEPPSKHLCTTHFSS